MTINQLFDSKAVRGYFQTRIPDFVAKHNLDGLTITAIKRNMGGDFYHVVIRYDAPGLGGQPIFCTAHWNENRQNAFRALQFINKNGFDNNTPLPEPIFYDEELRAFFYRGIDGDNLRRYIERGGGGLDSILRATAGWIAQLHAIKVTPADNFNPENSRIKTAIPGPDYFLNKIKRKFPRYLDRVESSFRFLVSQEEKNFARENFNFLIHGDFHPENVIIGSEKKVTAIDFTDISIADWARDVGNFMFQFGYMASGIIGLDEIRRGQELFLQQYLKQAKINLNDVVMKRINLYQAWAALRGVVYFLTKLPAEPSNASFVLKQGEEIIKLITN